MTRPGPLPDQTPNGPSAMDSDRLACGADVDAILEQVADGAAAEPTEHQQHCPHCQAALAELSRLWEPVREYAAAPATTAGDIASAVMTAVKALIHDVWYTLDIADGGRIQVAARVVAALARNAARRVPGVRVALGRSTRTGLARTVERATARHRHPDAAVGVLGRTAVIDLALAVSYGPPIHDVARQVQRTVIEDLTATLGLQQVTVNIVVDDIVLPAD